jgi:hypothetical protein
MVQFLRAKISSQLTKPGLAAFTNRKFLVPAPASGPALQVPEQFCFKNVTRTNAPQTVPPGCQVLGLNSLGNMLRAKIKLLCKLK